jgi:hypothetical protein
MNELAKLRLNLIIYLTVFSVCCSAPYVIAEQQCTGDVCFSWAFGAIVGSEDNRQLRQINRDTELNSGDQFKMLLKLKKECFVYVYYYSSQGELYMLFPYNLSQFSNDYEVSKDYYIPKGNFVLELDEIVGKEKIYLIASNKRIPELENLYTSYNSAEYTQKPELIKKIIQEIRTLRKRYKKFTVEAERPVASIGSIRGPVIREAATFTDLKKIAVEFNAKNFFAKTFTIDHK